MIEKKRMRKLIEWAEAHREEIIQTSWYFLKPDSYISILYFNKDNIDWVIHNRLAPINDEHLDFPLLMYPDEFNTVLNQYKEEYK